MSIYSSLLALRRTKARTLRMRLHPSPSASAKQPFKHAHLYTHVYMYMARTHVYRQRRAHMYMCCHAAYLVRRMSQGRIAVCRQLTYAHVCSRMLTYAHVCIAVCRQQGLLPNAYAALRMRTHAQRPHTQQCVGSVCKRIRSVRIRSSV